MHVIGRLLFISFFVVMAWTVSVLVADQSRADILLTGLEDQADVKDYIQKNVIEGFKETEQSTLRPVKVKNKIEAALKALGYYTPRVTFIVKNVEQTTSNQKNSTSEDQEQTNTDADTRNPKKNDLVFNVKTGSIYKISTINFDSIVGTHDTTLQTGVPLDAKTVLSAQSQLFKKISSDFCVYNLVVEHEIVLDHIDKTADLTFIITGDSDAVFGETTFTGADEIKRSYLQRFVKHEDNACWDASKVEATKAALIDTGLIATVNLDLPEKLAEDRHVPLEYKLKAAAPREVKLGANFNTNAGPGVSAEWKHKNYMGEGETLSVKARISLLIQSIGVALKKPYFLSDKQTLNASITAEREDNDAFEELSLNVKAGVTRKLSDHWSASIGGALELSQIEEDGQEKETFGLVSIPSSLDFDNRDDVLDPHEGFTLGLKVEPFFDAFGETDPFTKARITGTTYFDLGESTYDPVLAFRASIGSIIGASTNDIPANKRFFAGGGGSIRGFGFQEAGPQDDEGNPLGGKSIIETTAELRMKVTETIGGVAFVDGGGVYDTSFPDVNETFYVGAGVGARYYTSFGPVRFDVAVPVNQRDNTDQSFQIYISIGQAF